SQPEDVVDVEVAQQDVHPAEALRQLYAETAYAGAGVEDHDRVVGGGHLHTRRVPAVARGGLPRRRYRTTDPPERDVHRCSQKIAIAPRCRSLCPIRGMAVTDR